MILSAMSEKFSSDQRISLISTVTTAEDFLSTVLRVPVDLGIICWTLPQLGGEKIIEDLKTLEDRLCALIQFPNVP